MDWDDAACNGGLSVADALSYESAVKNVPVVGRYIAQYYLISFICHSRIWTHYCPREQIRVFISFERCRYFRVTSGVVLSNEISQHFASIVISFIRGHGLRPKVSVIKERYRNPGPAQKYLMLLKKRTTAKWVHFSPSLRPSNFGQNFVPNEK